ncbi:MAG: ABC transporter permease, partial [Planctomycetales bacterium]|nr:ABC transporter permease [Planctomycetales bacterium]
MGNPDWKNRKEVPALGVGSFVANYGMLLVLLLLGLLFSLLTLSEQHPTGESAGREVALRVAQEFGARATVLIVLRDTAEDRAYSRAVDDSLVENGLIVVKQVHGSPATARKALEEVVASGTRVDAVIVNNVTAKWNIYERYPEIGIAKLRQPSSHYWPTFLKLSNLLGVASQTAIYAIIAIGMTMVIITAGIDLSVGSLVALSSVVSAILLRDVASGISTGVAATFFCCAAGVAICALSGMFTGLMVTAFKIPPFIVTLAVMMIASGLAFRLSAGRSIPELPAAFFWIGGGASFGIPNPIVLMVVLYLAAHLVMSRMTFGRYVYAIGGN